MLLTNSLTTTEGINKVQVMMATTASKDMLKEARVYRDELEKAESNGVAIVVDTNVEGKADEVLEEVDDYLIAQSISADEEGFKTVRTWDNAEKALPDANVAL